MDVKSILPY